jgi:transcriptional regulator with XRE-family HTH domain
VAYSTSDRRETVIHQRYGDDTNDENGKGAPMTLLRRVLGEALRGRRLRQRRTLREVSGAARVSLGYLSEVERGQKEASSELLASICEALDLKLSDLLREVSETMRRAERAAEVARVPGRVILPAGARTPVPAGVGARPGHAGAEVDEIDPDAFEAEFDGALDGPLDGSLDRAFDVAPVDRPDQVAGERVEATDSVAADIAATDSVAADSVAAEPVEAGDLDALDEIDLSELETGDGLGEAEALLGLTDLPCRYEGPHAARCLTAAA